MSHRLLQFRSSDCCRVPQVRSACRAALCIIIVTLNASAATVADEPFRPETGKFPPLEKARSYHGQLVFVDHANRRGSLRVASEEPFFRNPPSPFTMLPYGMVRYQGAPADLRDVPLGTMLHGRFYLPPDLKTSSVPIVQKPRDSQPAENHAILLEDEPSFCLREGKVWKLKEVEIRGLLGMITASRELMEGDGGEVREEKLIFDSATRFWRGREKFTLEDLISEGTWPASGKKLLGRQAVLLGLTWKPARGWVGNPFNQLHISDLWLDETAMKRAGKHQTEEHKIQIRTRWMPAWVDHVEYGKFGHATVTATLFGGMDPSLYEDFKNGIRGQMAASEVTLKHLVGGTSGHPQMAIEGPILNVTRTDGEAPLGSSGIQIRLKVDLLLEGFRPGRIVRIRPLNWPDDPVPREEYIQQGNHEERFPLPGIFPNYEP